jgi:excinuclease UvrABC ATPase subunit
LLAAQGYTRIHEKRGDTLQVIQDRFRWSSVDPARAGDAIEAALKVGQGRLDVYPAAGGETSARWRFSTGLHCPLRHHYKDPSPSTFSFNSPDRRLRNLPRLRPQHRRRLRLVIPDDGLESAPRRHQALADRVL